MSNGFDLGAALSMSDNNSVEEILRALGRVEGALEASKQHREEMARSVFEVRKTVEDMRQDVHNHLIRTNEHERRIGALEALPPLIAKMANHGERLIAAEGKIDDHEIILHEVRGMSRLARWLWAGVLVAAGCVSWMVQFFFK